MLIADDPKVGFLPLLEEMFLVLCKYMKPVGLICKGTLNCISPNR